MNNIEVAVLDTHAFPGSMMVGLARLTQRGHNITTMDDLRKLFEDAKNANPDLVRGIAKLPHGTIKRFCPITIGVVGASRRFLAQARTHQVGFNYVSASLQYSDYSDKGKFVVPYEILKADNERVGSHKENYWQDRYISSCNASMECYSEIAAYVDNDTAGYAAPQGLRNILVLQANHDAWMNFIRLRSCNRNTPETQYVTLRIWEELLKTPDGEEMFAMAGPDCMYGACREGKMCCGKPLKAAMFKGDGTTSIPRNIINHKWPLIG